MSRTAMFAAGSLVLLLLTAASCSEEDDGVQLGTASVGTVDEIVEAPGSVTARTAATLSAPAAGTVSDVLVEPGDQVKKGAILAVLKSPELERRRDAAEEALDQAPSGGGIPAGDFTEVRERTDERAEKAFQQARTAATEVTDPALQKALLQQVDTAREQYAAASDAAAATLRAVQRGVASLGEAVSSLSAAQKMQAQQAYELADAAVDALTLRAPVSGVVQFGGPAQTPSGDISTLLGNGGTSTPSEGVDSAITEGSYVAAGTPLLTVIDLSRLGLAAEVDETDVLLVKPGVKADVELDAATGATYQATVRSVDLLPTTSARGGVSYRVRLDLGKGVYPDGPAPAPRPGMSAVIRLKVRQVDDAVTVPASAVVSADGQDTVWAVRDGRYEPVPVRLGVQGEETVQVISGVDAGQQIVVAGADQVERGDKAR
ncbi:multidrug efflux pump subunit AcrA (membrane-fusion protein) [Actinoplanes octamycinicus]|uniref:Multidrug efflux pump subunit AcrA (Membrane-fusion protein) n=2 Tax=Actinoplanes octamycinicus TaxID=135948 RepID=A0A7W7MBP9_9ACTN|nr:efflux RND transporter periplasmic adaptor subunit [Actinoplanes octamycinicus]MBB4744333.1 multidrug efflux pump subunit AcrA (membrane-fusion protein) [Actinoplanes octamycinicus]GIE56706.1 RND transporter [Actinoplanes octamycinicus]